jgi:hypothetical protein
MWSYILNFATAALAAFTLAKDWDAHKHRWRRGFVILAIVSLLSASAVNTHLTAKKSTEQSQVATKQRQADVANIASLQTAVTTANLAQRANTKIFVDAFSTMTQRLNNMQSAIKTAGLEKEAIQLRADLASTRLILAPRKAQLEATFSELPDGYKGIPPKSISTNTSADGTLALKLHVVNTSANQAGPGGYIIRICTSCAYVDPPSDSIKVTGSDDNDRLIRFESLPASMQLLSVMKVRPPSGSHSVALSVKISCSNCDAIPFQILKVDF